MLRKEGERKKKKERKIKLKLLKNTCIYCSASLAVWLIRPLSKLKHMYPC